MRRLLLPATAVLAAAAFLVPAAAQASFHLQTVNEVMLAGTGGATDAQFVELLDQGGAEETFPAADGPFGLSVFDAAGQKLGSQTLNGPGMATASASGTPYLVSTAAADTALGVKGNEPLSVALPATAGQACYTAAGSPFSCVTWGCITKAVAGAGSSGTAAGALPPDGSSLQRRGSGGATGVGPPTPGAANTAKAGGAACPGHFTGVAFRGRHATLHGRRASIKVRCPAGTSGSCHGRLSLVYGSRRHPHRAGSAAVRIRAGKRATVHVTLSRAARAAYRADHHLRFRATLRAHDGAGHTHVSRATLHLGEGGGSGSGAGGTPPPLY
jgi:hypothetical protein